MMPQIKRILYTTDLSPNAVFVLRYAIDSAKKHGAKLVILHVLEALSPTAIVLAMTYLDPEHSVSISEEKIDYTKKRILKRLQTVCQSELNGDPEAEGIVESIEVVEGYPADEILARADKFNCDIIFMGTHGKGFLNHSYFGSVSKRVLRRARKPVFIVPLPAGEIDITIHDA
jgi:nucleotide-binding universal stress UspA family protein